MCEERKYIRKIEYVFYERKPQSDGSAIDNAIRSFVDELFVARQKKNKKASFYKFFHEGKQEGYENEGDIFCFQNIHQGYSCFIDNQPLVPDEK